MADEHTYKFNVVMTCSGCSGAISRVLAKTEGVSSYDVSLEKQEVIVNGTIPYDDVLAKIKKTGKEASLSIFYHLITLNDGRDQVKSGETVV